MVNATESGFKNDVVQLWVWLLLVVFLSDRHNEIGKGLGEGKKVEDVGERV